MGLTLEIVGRRIVRCARCPRLRAYCARVARDKKREFRDWDYWGKPVPGFGDPRARLLVVPGSGHATPHDRPETFNRAVLEFLSAS